MQGMKSLTKQDLIDLVNEAFPGAKESEAIATFFYCADGHNQPQQQCILLHKEIYNPQEVTNEQSKEKTAR